MINTLRMRERIRETYWKRHDPIVEDRMLWRAQSFRHIMHVLPGHKILELGCGDGIFTRHLVVTTRNECSVTAVTFDSSARRPANLPENVNFMVLSLGVEPLGDRKFDFVIAHDMLDRRSAAWLLNQIYNLLAPGGQALFYESNPWNVILKIRRGLMRLWQRDYDPRLLLSRPDLYELLSEVGFIRIFAVFNDFVYPPLSRHMIWILRNLSIVLENIPGIRTLAGSILLRAQKPPRPMAIPHSPLVMDERLRGTISVVVPCHNEEMNVGPLVSRLCDLYGEYIHEIILVEDNSKDDTRKVIGTLTDADPRIKSIYRTPPNGVGRAIADGLRAATGNYILSLDCDFQHILPEVRDMFDAAAEGYDVVVGSRFSRHSVLLNYPWLKIIANRAFHTLAQFILWARFRDLTNNLKLMRREAVGELVLLEPGFAVNAEIGLQPLIAGFRVKEIPVSWVGRGTYMGASSFNLVKVGGGYWRVLWRLWLRRFLGIGQYRTLNVKPARPENQQGRFAWRINRIGTVR
jgi:glycosyltransferase involved in cell wall biosynthesis/SAM-dependent methyltransferase